MSKKSFMKVALEEIEQQELAEQIEQDNQQAKEGEPEQLDQGFHDITDAESDIDQHLVYINEVVIDVEDLQAVSDFTEGASAEGGLDSTTAEILDAATESLYERLGVRPSVNHYASESFGSKDTRVSSTRLALEGFKEFIKSMWEAIKAAFKKMGMYLKHYISMVFSLNAVTIRIANELRDSILKKPISGSNKAFVDDKVLNITVAGDLMSLISSEAKTTFHYQNLAERLQKSTLTVATSFKLVNTFSQYLNTGSDLKSLVESQESFDKLDFPDLKEGFKISERTLYEKITGETHTDSDCFKSDEMIGDRAIYIILPKDSKDKKGMDAIESVAKTKISLATSKSATSEVKNEMGVYAVPAVSPLLHSEILKTVIFTSEKISESQKGYIDLVNKHDKMIKEIEAVEQMLGQSEADYSEYKSRVAAVRSFSNSVNRLTAEMIKAVSGSLVKSCHASVSLISQSYKAYLKYQ